MLKRLGLEFQNTTKRWKKNGIRIRTGPFWHPIYTIDLIIFKQDIIRCVFWCSVEVGPINTKQTSTRCSRQCIQLGVETSTTISISDENPMFSSPRFVNSPIGASGFYRILVPWIWNRPIFFYTKWLGMSFHPKFARFYHPRQIVFSWYEHLHVAYILIQFVCCRRESELYTHEEKLSNFTTMTCPETNSKRFWK